MAVTGFDDRDIIGMLLASYEETMAGSWASQVGLMVGSSSASETYGFLGGNPAMREWLGARQAKALNKKQYTITNKAYEATLRIHQNDLNRDKSGLLQARLSAFAADAGADHWQTLLTDLVNANGACYDGQSFFDTDHSMGDSGTHKNEVGSTEVPSANVGTAAAPTPTEMANVIMESVGHMMTFKNDQGRLINGSARSFLVVVSTNALFSAAVQATTGKMLTGNVDNPLAGFSGGGFNFGVILDSRLTSATEKVRIFRTDGALKPFLLQEEQGLQTDLLGRGSDWYFDNKEIKIGVDAIRAVGYGEWAHALSVTLS